MSFEKLLNIDPFSCDVFTDFYHVYDHVYLPFRQFDVKYGEMIYIKTDYLQLFFTNFKFSSPCYLVSGLSDYSPSLFYPDDILKNILDNKIILGWIMQNCIIDHPKIIKRDICVCGLSPDLDEDKMLRKYLRDNRVRLSGKPKKDQIFIYHNNDNNPNERNDLDVLFKQNKNCFNKQLNYQEYLEEMSQYKYVLCPISNGIDGNRKIYESIYCGCIPIIRVPKENLDTYENFPYICLPGKCYVRLGNGRNGERIMDSIFRINKL